MHQLVHIHLEYPRDSYFNNITYSTESNEYIYNWMFSYNGRTTSNYKLKALSSNHALIVM